MDSGLGGVVEVEGIVMMGVRLYDGLNMYASTDEEQVRLRRLKDTVCPFFFLAIM